MELQQLRYFVAVVEAGGFSRAAARLAEGLKAWREPPLGEVPHLFLDARCEKVRMEGKSSIAPS